MAAVVADVLGLPLDVGLARKVGAPGNPELAIGAVGPDGGATIDDGIVERLRIPPDWVDDAVGRTRREVEERVRRFRVGRPPLDVAGRPVIVVDDGLATGNTAAAIGDWLRRAGAGSTLAVPVGPVQTVERLREIYDDVVVVDTPEPFFAVGEFYGNFDQVSDDEVRSLLAAAP